MDSSPGYTSLILNYPAECKLGTRGGSGDKEKTILYGNQEIPF